MGVGVDATRDGQLELDAPPRPRILYLPFMKYTTRLLPPRKSLPTPTTTES
jgi:hypothetical protein